MSVNVSNLTVTFDGFKAVDDVSLLMLKGQVHFLIGPNGAGKTTLVDALTGLVPSTGTALYNGMDLLSMKTNKIIRAGVGRRIQTAAVFDELSVLQNLDIAGGLHRRAWGFRQVPGVPEYVESGWRRSAETACVTSRPASSRTARSRRWLRSGCLPQEECR